MNTLPPRHPRECPPSPRLNSPARKALCLLALCFAFSCQTTSALADDFDTLRLKWLTMITGGTAYNVSDPDIAAVITTIRNGGQDNWTNMLKTGGNSRVYLWPDLAGTTSPELTANYRRLRSMAMAYGTTGSSLYHNTSLLADIIGGLDWMQANRYNTSKSITGNWWDWEIGAQLALNDAIILVYDGLTATQITNYCDAMNHFLPDPQTLPENTGANLVWKSELVLLRAILQKNAAEVISARDALSPVFAYSWDDGFHMDGSFLQHTGVAYNGGYGKAMLLDLSNTLYLLKGSIWEVTDPDQENIFNWIYDSFMPFIYKGGFMSTVRGREISRQYAQDHNTGHDAIESLLRWPQIVPTPDVNGDGLAFKRMLKYWVAQDTFQAFLPSIGDIDKLVLAKALLADPATPMSEPVFNQPLPEMDRVVHLRPGFGFSLSMYSSRIKAFEYGSNENAHGWYTGYGMTSIYNNDLDQYDGHFWPTVNSYRLPGTTVDTRTLAAGAGSNGATRTENWVGSAEIAYLYGVAGMSLQSQHASLTGKKSWFMFDDEIVALGAGITSTDTTSPLKVETIVENRRLDSTGSNVLTVNSTIKPTTIPWVETMANTTWIRLAGTASGASVGYYFPTPTTVTGLRESRADSWSAINPGQSSTSVTNRYLSLSINHGSNPTNATYAYALLPNKTAAEMGAYASSPQFTVLENTTAAQAVKETTLNITGANFWADAVKSVGGITSNKKACVLMKETSTDIEVAVSDPTQVGSSIDIEIARPASGIISNDIRVKVTQLNPTIKFTVDVSAQTGGNVGNGIRGHTWKVKFSRPGQTIKDNADTSGIAITGTWQASSGSAGYYGTNYLHDQSLGKGTKNVSFTPSLTAGVYNVYTRWTADPNRATNVPVTITHAAGSSTVPVNQQLNGSQWMLMGTYAFNAGTGRNVTVSNTGTTGFVVADAVMFEGPSVPTPPVVIVDNNDATGVVKVGTWQAGSGAWGFYGTNYVSDVGVGKSGLQTVTFTPVLTAGTYKVYTRWTEGTTANRAPNVPYTVTYQGGSTTLTINQQIHPGEWVLLGTYAFATGSAGNVKIANTGTLAGQAVVADAVMFVGQ